MAVSVVFNNVTYSVPTTAGESGWASTLSSYLQALASGAATTSTVKQNIRTATATPVTVVAATDYTVVTNLTVPGAVAVNLPAGVAKQVFVIVDGKGDAGTNNITVDGNGAETLNGSATYVINENYGGIMLQFNGTGWIIIASFYGTSASFTNITVTGTATIGALVATSATVGGAAVTTASNAQTLTGKSIDADTNTITNIDNNDIKSAAGIDATKIADGSVTSTEFQYINTLSSNAQTQLDNKQSLDSDLTAIAALSSNGMIARTGTGTAAVRTLTGTANKVTITNGDGVSGNPTFDVGSNVVQVGGNTTGATMRMGADDSNDVVLESNGSDRITARVAAAANADIKLHGTAGVELPPGTTAQRPSSPIEGTIRYNTSNTEFEGYSSGAWQAVGGGINEQPLKNYLKSYAQAVVAPGTLSTLASTTSNLVSLTAFYADATSGSAALTSSSSTTLRGSTNYLTATGTSEATGARFVQFPAFSLDGTDLGKPVSISFDVNNVTTDGNWDAVMVRYNSSGVHQEIISIAGNASSGTTPVSAKLPTGTTTFNGFFIPGSTAGDLYALRLRSLANTVQIRVDTLFVGPQPVRVGAAVTDWQSYTPTLNNVTLGNGTVSARYRRVGDTIEIVGYYGHGSTSSVTGFIGFPLPSGLTVDTAKYAAPSNSNWKGSGIALDASPINIYSLTAAWVDARSAIEFGGPTTSNGYNASIPFTWATGDYLSFTISLPIVGWSSNITMADRAVESYAFNTSISTTASDTTSFGYGAGGAQIQLITAGLQRRVRFPDTIQPTDSLIFEVSGDQKQWFPLSSGAAVVNGSTIGAWAVQSSTTYGVGRLWQVNSTDVDVSFGQFSLTTGASWTATGQNYGSGLSTAYWRVRKVSGGAQVGYPIASSNIVGRVDGNAPASGYVGESLSNTGTATVATSGYTNVATITLTPGRWSISFICRASGGGAQLALGAGLASASASNTGWSAGDTSANNPVTSTADGSVSISNIIVNLVSSQQYWLTAQMQGASSSNTGRLTAVRIA